MKKLISLFLLISLVLSLSACNGGIPATASQEMPTDRELIDVEVEEYGDIVYFSPKSTIRNVSVNKMIYDYETDSFLQGETVFETKTVNSGKTLRIILDLQKEIPYVMIKYKSGFSTYEQYLFRDESTGEIFLLER